MENLSLDIWWVVDGIKPDTVYKTYSHNIIEPNSIMTSIPHQTYVDVYGARKYMEWWLSW